MVLVACSIEVDAIRSATGVTSLQGSDSRRKTLPLNVRGGSIGNNDDDDDLSMMVVPSAMLPRALSGGATDANDVEAAVEAAVCEAKPEDLAIKSSKWSDMRNRVLSAIGMIGFLALLSYYFKEDGLSVFVVLLQAMMYGEMTRTVGGDDWGSAGATIRKYWWFVTAVIAWDAQFLYPWKRTELHAVVFGVTVLTGVVGSILSFQRTNSGTVEFREYIRQTAVSLLSAYLVILPSSFWIGSLEEHGMKWIFFPAALVAVNDIMAYVFGRMIGKHPLLPSISPKKTWEGFLGATASTVGAAWLLFESEEACTLLRLSSIDRTDAMVLAGVASILAPFAGFLASVMKRAYGRKDFGTIFPGHGGFVDRLDCQLIMAPFVYFYLSLYKLAPAAASS